MKWLAPNAPCPGCGAKDDTIAHLRRLLDDALDHNRRLERIQAGASELPAKPKKPPEPMPEELRLMIEEFGSEQIQKRLSSEALASYQQHGSWIPARQRLEQVLAESGGEE